MRHFLLFSGGLLAMPLIAQADTLSAIGEGYFLFALLPFVLAGLGLLVYSLLQSLRNFEAGKTGSKTSILILLNLLLGMFISFSLNQTVSKNNLFPNLWTKGYVPLACLLLALTKLKSSSGALERIRIIAVIIGCSLALIGGMCSTYFPQVYAYDEHGRGSTVALIALGVTAVGWVFLTRMFSNDLAALSKGYTALKMWWLFFVGPSIAVSYLILLQSTLTWLADASSVRSNHRSITINDVLLTFFLYSGWGLILYLMRWGVNSQTPKKS